MASQAPNRSGIEPGLEGIIRKWSQVKLKFTHFRLGDACGFGKEALGGRAKQAERPIDDTSESHMVELHLAFLHHTHYL